MYTATEGGSKRSKQELFTGIKIPTKDNIEDITMGENPYYLSIIGAILVGVGLTVVGIFSIDYFYPNSFENVPVV